MVSDSYLKDKTSIIHDLIKNPRGLEDKGESNEEASYT